MGFQDCIFWTSPFLPLPGKWLYCTNYFFDILFFLQIYRETVYIYENQEQKKEENSDKFIYFYGDRGVERETMKKKILKCWKKLSLWQMKKGGTGHSCFLFWLFFFFLAK